MPASKDVIFYRYSPDNMKEKDLYDLFVGRDKLFSSIFTELKNSARNKTSRFFLLVGPRGIGKSHFMTLLYYEIKRSLATDVIPIKFSEEEYSIINASDFFLRILELYDIDTREFLKLKEENLIFSAVVQRINEISRQEEKEFFIFIENLHELFKQLKTNELQKLRSVFQETNNISIIASAPIIFPALSDHEEPFYNFFQIFHLKELQKKDIVELMKRIAVLEGNDDFIKDQKLLNSKITGLSHLIGGSPRLVILIYEIITRGDLDKIENIFLKMVDEHTPYYQEIFQMLEGQKRKIFDVIISSPNPLTPTEIAEKSRIDIKTVNTLLRRLEGERYIISHRIKKRTYYEVRERLFRFWREMRQPLGRKRISLFVEFLTLWYSTRERRQQFKQKFALLQAGDCSVIKDVCYYAEALPTECILSYIPKITQKIIELGEFEKAESHIKILQESSIKISNKIVQDAGQLISDSKYEEALILLNQVLSVNPNDQEASNLKRHGLYHLGRYDEALKLTDDALTINPDDHSLLSQRCLIFLRSKKHDDGIEFCEKLLEKYSEDSNFISDILSFKSLALFGLNKDLEALQTANDSISKNPTQKTALWLKGSIHENLNEYSEMLQMANRLLELDSSDKSALGMKGRALYGLEKAEEAVEIFNEYLKIDQNDASILFYKACALARQDRIIEAIESILLSIKIEPTNAEYLEYYGLLLASNQQILTAIEIFDRIIKNDPDNNSALKYKCYALNEIENFDEALVIANNLLKGEPDNPEYLILLGTILGNLKKYDEAQMLFEKALQIKPNDDFALVSLLETYVLLQKFDECIQVAEKVIDSKKDKKIKTKLRKCLIESYISENMNVQAMNEISKIGLKFDNFDMDFVENINEIFLKMAFNEYQSDNYDYAKKLLEQSTLIEPKLEEEKIKSIIMDFLKNIIDLNNLELVKKVINTIVSVKGDDYEILIKPIRDAINIIDTKNTNYYYSNLQSEEREIVSDIVKRITKSDNLQPI